MGSGDSSMVPSLKVSKGTLLEGYNKLSTAYQLPVKGSSTQSVGSVSRQSGGSHSRDLLPGWTAEDQEMDGALELTTTTYQYTPPIPIELLPIMY